VPDWHYASDADDEPHALQGDIFADVDVFVPANDLVFSGPARVMVISHSCDFTKAESNRPNLPILVAPVLRVDDVESDLRGHAENDRVARYMRLPDEGPTEDGCVAALSLIQPVAASTIAQGTRIGRIPEDARLALADRIVMLLFQSDRKPSS
jgi:hypothetical protein